jgi:hypothetical protein
MTDFDQLAERFQTADGSPLVDYLGLALPFYLLQIDCLISEKRILMPVEEFILKAVLQGATSTSEALGTLGLDGPYGRSLIGRLVRDEYLGEVDERLIVRPKAELALSEDGQRRVYEKAVPVLWDPVLAKVVRGRVDLVRSADAKAEALAKVMPQSARVPPLAGIPLDILASNSSVEEGEHVIRHLAFRRRTLMYRRGLLLLYGAGKGREPFARVAIDGVVDSTYSAAFVEHGLLSRLGVDSAFSRRMGATAVEQRIRPLGDSSSDASLRDLLRQRSALQVGISGLERQADSNAATKLDEKRAQLTEVQRRLENFPIRAMLPFEMPRMIDYALQKARERVTITTTVPTDARLTSIRLLLIQQALKNGVQVRILLSDRPKSEEIAGGHGSLPLLAKLNDLMRQYQNLEVGFLRDTDRVVFEVTFDGAFAAVSNDPPLGLRSREPMARLFSGYALAGKKFAESYNSQYMGAEALHSVERIRMPAPQSKRVAAPSKRKR